MNPEIGFLRLLEGFDKLEIPYMVGGSGASSVHGLWRATGDIDFIARLDPENIAPLVDELKADFYIDEDQIRTAIRYRRSFNAIHFASSYKFDIFPLGADRYQQVQFSRRRFTEGSPFKGEPIEFAVASPEDTILSKLLWYKAGGGTSTVQWNDVLGVIAVQRDRLDMPYLREWAAYLKIDDLLEQALAERHEALD